MDQDPSAFLRSEKVSGGGAALYDAKKWVWVPDDTAGFLAAELKEQKGDSVVLELNNGSTITMDINDTQQMNPPKFEKVEDMASLTYLNEASVLHNLQQRYYSSLIYTYSGLFCVAVNPYRRLPIYTNKVVDMFKGRRKTEMPPHIYSIADNAYRDMLQDRENQSVLITGESGAGKTENTKKVIQYFASIAPPTPTGKQDDTKKNLEEQVIQTNPVLEAFGNAKTIRNDNSSRFGKFIRIHFGNQGKIAGADIEYYLLEKSRVISQQPGERCYHIFYQLLAGADQELLNELLLSRQVKSYRFVENGEVSVDNIDDAEEYTATLEAMGVLGMEGDEIKALFKTLAGILHFGNIEVKQRPREEWATIPTTTDAEKVSHLLGISSVDLIKSLIKPRIRVGTEYVQQGRNMEQVIYSIGALSKSLYERMFSWIVKRANKTLDTKARKNFFIGVLDIAGFEIFTMNSFEQLCINYTNERLQQFFNHHMFVKEQEEYRKEGINWEFIDFGLDLQSTIDLIEKPMGVLALLDEESLFPKASDSTYVEKLHKNHDGKSVSYGKPNFKSKGSIVHFELHHYAGSVGYTVIGWLNKNKDPLNESVVQLLQKSTEPFIAGLWSDFQGASDKDSKRKKGSQFTTMAQLHKTSLGNLMTTLRNTIPHFVRCIIPNELKKPGLIDAHLVLHQLRCNGVLEGIRICRKGFPNRLIYQEFRQRYAILAPKAIPAGFMDGRKACELLLSSMPLEASEYRLGNSKVFFKAGVLGRLEDMRDEKLGEVLTQLQAFSRGYIMRKTYHKLLDQRLAIAVLQRNIRKYLFLRNWKWWKLYTKVKPLLNVARSEDELRQKEEELNSLRERILKEDKTRKEMDEQQTSLLTEKNELFIQLQQEQDQRTEAEENVQRLMTKKGELEGNVQELNERLDEEMENNASISSTRRKLEAEIDHLQENLEDLQTQMSGLDQEKAQKERDCQSLEGELEKINDNLSRTHKEKKALEERVDELTNSLQAEEDKANRLGKLKIKLENTIAETNDELEREKRLRGDVEKVRRKLEADIKATQDTVDNLDHTRLELEKHVTSKEKEISGLLQNVDDQSAEIAALQKKVRELEAKVEELEEDLENEQNNKARLEKQKNDLLRELDDLKGQLEEQGGATAAQIDMNRKREAELTQLRVDMATQNEEHEKLVGDMRKKQALAIGDLEEQVSAVQKSKSKFEKDVHRLNSEMIDTSEQLEESKKAKSNVSRKLAQVDEQLSEASTKVAEYEVAIAALQGSQAKLQSENTELSSQLGDAESKNGSLSKNNTNLSAHLDETKSELEMEIAGKLEAQSKLRSAQNDIGQLSESLEEEQEAKAALQKQLAAAKADAIVWRSKCEGEASQRIEELEEAKRKLQSKLKESDEALTELQTKFSALDKAKNRIGAEFEDLNLDLDKERNRSLSLEKKQKQVDKQITEWRSKFDAKEAELDQAKKEGHAASTELLNWKGRYTDLEESLAASKKESKRLQEELSDLEKQLNEGGMSVHELEKSKKRLEGEKEELVTALEEAEAQLENEEARVLRAQLELTQLKQETERRVGDKDDEIEGLRKNQQRQLDALQHSLDVEVKAKNDQGKQRKMVEGQLDDMQSSIDDLEKALSDSLKKFKSSQAQLKEMNGLYEEEQRLREEQHDVLVKAEKKVNDLNVEVEEVKAQMEQLQRSYRTCDTEKSEAQERVQELQTTTSSMQAAKRKAEQALATLQEEYEELEGESHENGEKLKKAVDLSSRSQTELLAAQDKLRSLEKSKNSLDQQVKELSTRLNEEVANATKAAKRDTAKLQLKIQEVENQLADETKARTDAQRALKKTDAKSRDFMKQLEEEKSNSQRLQEQLNQLSGKMRGLRREKEDAEGEAESFQKKLKQAKAQTEDAEDTNAMLQAQISKMRAAARKPKVTAVDDDA